MDIINDYWKTRPIREEAPLPTLLNIFYEPDMYYKNEHIKIIKSCLEDNAPILDIGAGDKNLETILKKAGWTGLYYSMDIEGSHSHTYSNIDAIDRQFNALFMCNLIEHMTLAEGIKYLEKAFDILDKDGILVIITVNTRHINRFWESDITHKQPWPYRDSYAILKLIGFTNIKIYLLKESELKPTLKTRLKYLLNMYICKMLGVDSAELLMIIAQK
jgi:predicted SAM-dependent methyltransferase